MSCANCRARGVRVRTYAYGVRLPHIASLCDRCAGVLIAMGMDLRERRPRPARDLTGWIHPGGAA